MVDDVLVDRRARRHEDRDARALPPARPTELLPRPRHRTRIAGQDRHVQPPDVDAELERIGRDDAEDLPVAQAVLDGPALRRQVAAAVAPDAAARAVALAQRLAQTGEQQLDRDPRPTEHDRLAPGAQEGEGPALRQRHGRSASAARRLQDRRVHEQDVALAGRGAVAVHQPRRSPGQHRRELARVPDRRGAAHDDRLAAVVRADPQQPAQDVGDVAAEHAAVRVQLVDDDELELLEQLEPLRVVRQDRRVEHVRVGHDDLPGGADGGPDRGRRVAVVGRRDDRQPGRRRELPELRHLVLAERLGREQEQRPGGRVLGDRLERGQRVAQRLARGGRRDDDDVLAGMDGLDRLGLVRVQPLDPAPGEARHDARVQPRRHRGVDRLAWRQDGVMDDAAGEGRLREQAVQDGRGIGGGVECASSGSPSGIRTDVRYRRQSTPTLPRSFDSLAVTRASVDTPAARSYARRHVPPLKPRPRRRARPGPGRDRRPRRPTAPDLAALPIAGITRRRIAILACAMLAAWIVIAFARQVGEASAATARADDIASANAALRIEVGALERELELIARQRYVEQQGRAYGLGGAREIAFTLEKDAPALPDDAPGSAALRIGAQSRRRRSARALADGAVRPVRLTDPRVPTRTPVRGSLSCPPDALAPDEGGRGADDRHPGRGLRLRRLHASSAAGCC